MKSKAIVVLLGLVLSGALAAQTPSGGPIAELDRRIQELEQQLAALEPGALGTALQITDVNGKVFGPVLGDSDSVISEVLIGDRIWRVSVSTESVGSRASLGSHYLFQDWDCSSETLIDAGAFSGLNSQWDIWENWLPYGFSPVSGFFFKVPKVGVTPRTVQIRSFYQSGVCINDTQTRQAYFEEDLEVVDPTDGFDLPFSIPVQSR